MQAASATQIQFGRRDIGGIFGRIIGQPEERLAHLRGGGIAERRMPGGKIAQPVEPIVGRTVEREHVEFLLDQGNEREEERTVEPVLVEIVGRPVAGGHHGHAMVADQRGEQAAHDGRVGGVGDDHLVEGEAPDVLGDVARDLAGRIARVGGAPFGDAPVHLEHEFVEMGPPLFRNAERFDKEVHQHRLAASDTAPHVDALRARLLGPEQLRQQATRTVRLQFLLQPVEPLGRAALIGIGAQFTGGDEPLVAGEHAGHSAIRRFIFFTMPEKLATV